MKKQFIAAALIAALGLTACGEAKTSEKTSEKATEATKAAEVTTEATTEAATTAEITTEAATEAAVPTELSKTYADLDNRSFKLNGKLLTLGVSTLQDVLDAGVELVPDSLHGNGYNFDVEYNKSFKGDLSWNGFIYRIKDTKPYVELTFINPTGKKMTMKECILAVVKISMDRSLSESIPENIEFAFGDSLTADELISNSGEPTYKEDDTYHYKVISDKYPDKDNGYCFTISDTYGFSRIEMSWMP